MTDHASVKNKRWGFEGTYNLLYGVFCLFSLPHFLIRIQQSENPWDVLKQRMGFYPQTLKRNLKGKEVVWVHAVSVGEVMAVTEFLKQFLNVSPNAHVLLTTVTPTGQKVAKTLEGERLSVCYVPFDFSWTVRQFLNLGKFKQLILMETEIWPNLIEQAYQQKIPIQLLNARLSEKSVRRYQRFGLLFESAFQSLSRVLVQTIQDGERFCKLGVVKDKVHVVGNMKFDNVSLEPVSESVLEKYRQDWNFKLDDMIWVAGSTHPGEEEILLEVFKTLRAPFPRLKLVLAPRHIERASTLKELVKSAGFNVRLSTEKSPADYDVFILDQLGILKKFYALANFVFMGGSLVHHGGQNPIEPAACKKPILSGPHTFNFQTIYEELQTSQGALLIRNQDELKAAAEKLLRDAKQSHEIGERAFAWVKRHQGATDRYLQFVTNPLQNDLPAK